MCGSEAWRGDMYRGTPQIAGSDTAVGTEGSDVKATETAPAELRREDGFRRLLSVWRPE